MLEDVFKRSEREVFGSGANITASGPLLVRAVSGEVISHISGEVVQVSGQQVRIEGYDYESSVWRNLRVTQSGEIYIHATIVDIVQARVSGQAVKVSGEMVMISGQRVWVSGQAIQVSGQAVKISGEAVQISGQTIVAEVSGDTVIAKISGEAVRISGQTVVAEVSGETVQISGQAIQISGQTVVSEISGETVIAKVSGEAIRISGQLVNISGQIVARISGEAVKISGEVTKPIVPTQLRAGYTLITSLSGGTELSSGEIRAVNVRNLPGNANMWMGRPGVLSGTGWLLQGGEQKDLQLANLNTAYLFATNSGEYVCYIGEAE